MTRFEQLKSIDDVYQLIAFLEEYAFPCKTKATHKTHSSWCRQHPGREGCKQCYVDFWNEEVGQ